MHSICTSTNAMLLNKKGNLVSHAVARSRSQSGCLLVEEGDGVLFRHDRTVPLWAIVVGRLSALFGVERVEDDVLCALLAIGRIMDPDVDVGVGTSLWEADLAKDDGAIRHCPSTDGDEVPLLDVKEGEVSVRDGRDRLVHARLVLVPVLAASFGHAWSALDVNCNQIVTWANPPLEEHLFDLRREDAECLDGAVLRGVLLREGNLFRHCLAFFFLDRGVASGCLLIGGVIA